MTATNAKAAPKVNKDGTPRKPRTTAPKFDYSAVTAEVSDAKPKAHRKSKVDETPFPAWIRESEDTGKAKVIEIPEANAVQAENLIREAARRIDRGAAIEVTKIAGGKVRITFATKARRKYTKRATA